jgi:hypothetical protein
MSSTNKFRNGQRVRTVKTMEFAVYEPPSGSSYESDIEAGTYADIRSGGGSSLLDVTFYIPDGTGGTRTVYSDHCTDTRFESVRGKPFIPGVDGRRKDRTGSGTATYAHARPVSVPAGLGGVLVGPSRSAATATPDVENVLTTLREALTAKSGGIDEDAVRELVEDVVKPMREGMDMLDTRISDVVGRTATAIHDTRTSVDDLRTTLATVSAALAVATPAVKSRVRAALAASLDPNPIVDALAAFYTVGEEAPANVLLCSPPSLGKSYGVRTFAAGYDLYLEHGCSDDMDEIATLLGSPMPDGKGGFVTVDGVLTQAVRSASQGKNVLFLLDEVLRLAPRAQEWLLSFLTGVKRPDGTRCYRLRTRRVDADGALEIIECDAARLHIVGATNLGMIQPVEAFWSRWETVRLDFTPATVQSVATAILAAHGIPDAGDVLAKAWAHIVTESRKAVAEGTLRFPVDMRMLERAAQYATEPTVQAVGAWAAQRMADNVAHWNADLGDTLPQSVAVCDSWAHMLRSL